MHGSAGASEKSILQADFQKKCPCYVLTPQSKAPWSRLQREKSVKQLEFWRGSDDPAGYATPVFTRHRDRDLMRAWTPEHIRGMSPDTDQLHAGRIGRQAYACLPFRFVTMPNPLDGMGEELNLGVADSMT
jgi:hypothetical protein